MCTLRRLVPSRPLGVALVVALVVGCATTVGGCATPAATARADGPRARDFHGLQVGSRFTFRATPGPHEPRGLTIVGFDKGYFVDDRGGRLAPRSDGLFDGERFLLQDPLTVGHEWIAKAADQSVERYRIDATDVDVAVPAGTFHGCVQVTGTQQVVDPASGQPATLLVTSTWAPRVGVVRVEFRIQLGAAKPVTTSVTELVAFTPASAVAPALSPP
jgi:hypothetical protein